MWVSLRCCVCTREVLQWVTLMQTVVVGRRLSELCERSHRVGRFLCSISDNLGVGLGHHFSRAASSPDLKSDVDFWYEKESLCGNSGVPWQQSTCLALIHKLLIFLFPLEDPRPIWWSQLWLTRCWRMIHLVLRHCWSNCWARSGP